MKKFRRQLGKLLRENGKLKRDESPCDCCEPCAPPSGFPPCPITGKSIVALPIFVEATIISPPPSGKATLSGGGQSDETYSMVGFSATTPATMVATSIDGPNAVTPPASAWKEWAFGWASIRSTGRNEYAVYKSGESDPVLEPDEYGFSASMEWNRQTATSAANTLQVNFGPYEISSFNFFAATNSFTATNTDCTSSGSRSPNTTPGWGRGGFTLTAYWSDANASTVSSLNSVMLATIVLDDAEETEVQIPLRFTNVFPEKPCVLATSAINWMRGRWNPGHTTQNNRLAVTSNHAGIGWVGRIWIPAKCRWYTIIVTPQADFIGGVPPTFAGMACHIFDSNTNDTIISADQHGFDFDAVQVLYVETTDTRALIDTIIGTPTDSVIKSIQLSNYTLEATDEEGDALPDTARLYREGAIYELPRVSSRRWSDGIYTLTADGAWWKFLNDPTGEEPAAQCYSAPYDPSRFPGMLWFESWNATGAIRQEAIDEAQWIDRLFFAPPADCLCCRNNAFLTDNGGGGGEGSVDIALEPDGEGGYVGTLPPYYTLTITYAGGIWTATLVSTLGEGGTFTWTVAGDPGCAPEEGWVFGESPFEGDATLVLECLT